MTREILFRGKALNCEGTWLYGNYVHRKNRGSDLVDDYIVVGFDNNGAIKFGGIWPHTVGQFTGITDRNGVKIFEGDIVRYNDEPGHVEFDKENAEFLVFFDNWSAGFDSIYCDRYAEVIGNIYDNPELLGVSENA